MSDVRASAQQVAAQLREQALEVLEAAATIERIVLDEKRSDARDGQAYDLAVAVLARHHIWCTPSAHLSWGE